MGKAEAVELVRQLHSEGLALTTIAERIGLSKASIYSWLSRPTNLPVPLKREAALRSLAADPEILAKRQKEKRSQIARRSVMFRWANRPPSAMTKEEMEEHFFNHTSQEIAAALGVSTATVLKWRQIKNPLRMKECYAVMIREKFPVAPKEMIQGELPF
jgi:transposase